MGKELQSRNGRNKGNEKEEEKDMEEKLRKDQGFMINLPEEVLSSRVSSTPL